MRRRVTVSVSVTLDLVCACGPDCGVDRNDVEPLSLHLADGQALLPEHTVGQLLDALADAYLAEIREAVANEVALGRSLPTRQDLRDIEADARYERERER